MQLNSMYPFCNLLGWSQVRKLEDYPAIFVLNEKVIFTLWQTGKNLTSSDRRKEVAQLSI